MPRINIRGAPTFNRDDVEVPPGLTVAELRSRLAVLFDIDTDLHAIRLLIRGRPMHDTDPLSSYGVQDGSTVNMVVHARELLQQQQQQQPSQESRSSDGDVGTTVNATDFPWQSLAAAVASSLGASVQPSSPSSAQLQWTWSLGGGSPGGAWGGSNGGANRGVGAEQARDAAQSAGGSAVAPSSDATVPAPASPPTQGAGARHTLSSFFSGLMGGASRKRREAAAAAAAAAAPRRTSSSTSTSTSTSTTSASNTSISSGSASAGGGNGRGAQAHADAAQACHTRRDERRCGRRARQQARREAEEGRRAAQRAAEEGRRAAQRAAEEATREVQRAAEEGIRAAQRGAEQRVAEEARREVQRAAEEGIRAAQRGAEQRVAEEARQHAEHARWSAQWGAREARASAQQAADAARRHALQFAAEARHSAQQATADVCLGSGAWKRIVKDAMRDSKAATKKALREAFAEWNDGVGGRNAALLPPAARSAPEPEPEPERVTSRSATTTTTKTSPPSMDVAIGNAASVPLPPPLFTFPKSPPSPLPELASKEGSAQQEPQPQQQAVVHLHVHCTSDELDAMPLRLRRLAEQVPVAQVVLQTDTTEQAEGGTDSQPRTTTRNSTTATAAPTPPVATSPASLTAATQLPWIDEALSTTLATLGMPQLMQLAAGNYNVLASLHGPLQAQVQRRLAGTSGSLAAVAHVAHHEAQELSTRVLAMPAVQQLLERQAAVASAAGQSLDEAQQSTAAFRAELPRYLEHFYVAIMLHVRRTSLGAADWSRELRNIFVRHTGMALTRSVLWFDEGRQAFQPVVANVMLSLLQSSGVQQQYPMLQVFSSMLSPMLQSLLGQWGREYEQNMRRSDDSATFEQTAAPSSPPQRTSPCLYTPAAAREMQPPPQFEEVVKQASSLYSDKSSSGLAAPPPPPTPASDCPESHLLPAWNARHLFGGAEPRQRNAVDGGTDAAAAASTASKSAVVTAAKDDLDDLANELMRGCDDDDEKQPPTKAVSPKTRPLAAPLSTAAAAPAFSLDAGAGSGASRVPAAALEADEEADAASQARLVAAVEDWEDACGVPHAVAQRVSAMASRYAQARRSASASLRLSSLVRTIAAETGASAPPQPPSFTSIAGSTDNSSVGWVTWEANPYGDAPSSG